MKSGKRKFWRVAIPLCIALWTALIWGQSLIPAERSNADSQVVEQFLPPKAQDFSVEPQWWTRPLSGDTKYPIPITVFVRKAAHFAEFAVLGVLWGVCRRLYPLRLTWLYGAVVAVTDEWLQRLAAGRTATAYDVLIDTAGYLCGWALILLVGHIWKKKKK